jgi:hypothetical protein
MDALTKTAASGIWQGMQSVDLLAYSLTNATTAGCKQEQVAGGLYTFAHAAASVVGFISSGGRRTSLWEFYI